MRHQPIALKLLPTLKLIGNPGAWLELLAIGLFLLCLCYKTATAVNPDGRRRLLLVTTAAILGLLPFLLVYTVFSLRKKLESGDLLVAFYRWGQRSDERSGRGMGRGPLDRCDSINSARPSQLILDRIMASADAFVAGAPQYDDMTLIVMSAG